MFVFFSTTVYRYLGFNKIKYINVNTFRGLSQIQVVQVYWLIMEIRFNLCVILVSQNTKDKIFFDILFVFLY